MGNVQWVDLPPWALAGIVVLGLAQLSLQVLALVSVFRTPEERLLTGKRWVWILVVAFGQLIGAIIFFAAARRPVTQQDPLRSAEESSSLEAQSRRAADVLYGDSSDKKP